MFLRIIKTKTRGTKSKKKQNRQIQLINEKNQSENQDKSSQEDRIYEK